jgi:hypothetical protein
MPLESAAPVRRLGVPTVEVPNTHEHRRVPFQRHHIVQVPPVIGITTNSGRIDLADQARQLLALEPREVVNGSDHVSLTFDCNPVPARSKQHGDTRLTAEMADFEIHATRDEADAVFPGQRVG